MTNLPRVISHMCAATHCAASIFHGVCSDLVTLVSILAI